MKPISPRKAKQIRIGTPEHRVHLKILVVKRLNRELKKGSRAILVENHIDESLASEIASEYENEGWTVHLKDHTKDYTKWGWRFCFDVTFNEGDQVEVNMYDIDSFPEPFSAKILKVEHASSVEKSYLIEYQDDDGLKTMWLISRYLSKKS